MGIALQQMLTAAREERPAASYCCSHRAACGCTRPMRAELALGRALSALFDARATAFRRRDRRRQPVRWHVGACVRGRPTRDACPERESDCPGPKVLESVHGKWELDADDERDVEAVFGAKARSAMGFVDLVADASDAARAWVYPRRSRSRRFRDERWRDARPVRKRIAG
jgi:hypothetical protein